MKYCQTGISVTLCVILTLLGGCTTPPALIPLDQIEMGVYPNATNISHIITALDGSEEMFLIGETDAAGNLLSYRGAGYRGPDSEDFLVVYFGEDGLPTEATASGYYFRFSNYTTDTVDIIVLPPVGSAQQHLAVKVDPQSISDIRALTAQKASTIGDVLAASSLAVSFVGCGIGLVSSPTGLGLAVVVASCSGALLGSIALFRGDEAADLTGRGLNVVQCNPSPTGLLACLGVLLDSAAAALGDSENTIPTEPIDIPGGFPGTWVWNHASDPSKGIMQDYSANGEFTEFEVKLGSTVFNVLGRLPKVRGTYTLVGDEVVVVLDEQFDPFALSWIPLFSPLEIRNFYLFEASGSLLSLEHDPANLTAPGAFTLLRIGASGLHPPTVLNGPLFGLDGEGEQ